MIFMVKNEPEFEIEEHKHEDGTKHSHKGGNKPHTHAKSCKCNVEHGRHPRCSEHGNH